MELTLVVFLSTICTAVGYKISSCNANGRFDVKETSPSILTCTEITDDYMFWDFTPTGGTRIQIASCVWSNSKCNITDSDYAVTRPQNNTSTLTVRRNHRTKIAGVVRCGGAFNGGTATLSTPCSVRVVYPAKQVTNCRTEVDRTDWTVSGSCDVDKYYASDNQYTCRWFHVQPSGQQTSFYGVMPMFRFTDNGLEYYKGKCSFSGQPMPTTDGDHVYNLRIYPGQSPNGNSLFAGPMLSIQHPGDPVLSNCPPFVIEGDDVTCSCQASGSPPAVVTWVVGGTTDRKVLVLRNVSRSLDGHNYTCNQYWGGVNSNWRTTTYSVQVHYPPTSPPLISGVQDGGHIEGESLSLYCSVTGGNPLVSTITFWCRPAPGDGLDTTTTVNGVTTVTSYLTFERLDLTMNGTVCRCSAPWSERPSLYTQTATATITVIAKSGDSTAPGTTTSTTVFSLYTAKSTDSIAPGTTMSAAGTTSKTSREGASSSSICGNNIINNNNNVALVGGAVGGVAIVIIVALVIVIVVIWKRRCDPVYTKPTSRGQDDASPYSELSVYEHVDGQASGTAQYENSGMQQQEAKEQAQYENTDTEMHPSPYEGKYENTATQKEPAPPDRHYENSVKKIDE